MKTFSGIIALIALIVSTNLQAASSFCGKLENGYGPYDYSNSMHRTEKLPIVEAAHFSEKVEKLIDGESSWLGWDIDYTLRAFPNHYRALSAMARLGLREKTAHVKTANYTVECYFDRAIRFKPDDGMVRMIYGNYLLKLDGRPDDAFEQYHEAVRMQPENANINYNLGLMYMKKKEYEPAIVYAKKAYGLGFPLPGLRNQLMKKGKWDGKLDEEVRDEAEGNVDEKIEVEPQ